MMKQIKLRIEKLAPLGNSLLCLALLSSCSGTTQKEHESEQSLIVAEVEVSLDSLFAPLDTSFSHNDLRLPEGFTSVILFSEYRDSVLMDSQKIKCKGNHDMIAFLPVNDTEAQLYISHETRDKNDVLGHGGGATMFSIKNEKGWKVTSPFHHVQFKNVGNTDRNCGGSVAPNGMIYTCEESEPQSNKDIFRNGAGHTDTSSINGMAYWQNTGFVVEVDPNTKKATQKLIAMGRCYHEDIEFLEDGKTAFLTDDYEPAVLFKFVADQKNDYSKGQLYAFQQVEGKGNWIALPRDTSALLKARDVAIEMGASMFIRHEWLVRKGNSMYIAETGVDESDWSNRIKQGGTIPQHLKNRLDEKNVVRDVMGRILKLDIITNELSVLIEGGVSADGKTVFSNPDCISMGNFKGKDFMVIHEDINWYDKGRVPNYVEAKKRIYNELYLLDMDVENPTVEDLRRFAIAPMGAEFTGGVFSPDGSTLFLNIQHASYPNGKPYIGSMTIAITGWK